MDFCIKSCRNGAGWLAFVRMSFRKPSIVMSITLCLADAQRLRNERMNIDIVFDIRFLALLHGGKMFPSVVCKAS